MDPWKKRHIVPEIIDDFNWKGEELEQNLQEIEWINRFLGGASVTVEPVIRYIRQHPGKKLRIADIGCGSGDILKNIQDEAGFIPIELTGIDANIAIIEFARKNHFKDRDIDWVHADILAEPEKVVEADIYVLNLFLHHFTTAEIKKIMSVLAVHRPGMIVINDLHRSRLASFLFGLVTFFTGASKATKNDGKLSIQKGFTRTELQELAAAMPGYTCSLQWKWAFRWQLLVKNYNEEK